MIRRMISVLIVLIMTASMLTGCTVQTFGGNENIENINLVTSGEAKVAIVQNDIVYYTCTGAENFSSDDEIDNIRGMAMLYPEVVQILATKDSGIKEVDDLKDKKVALGAPDTCTEINARHILSEYGMTYDDLVKVEYISSDEASNLLKNKEVDAAFITGALPTSSIIQITKSDDLVLVPLSSGCIASLSEKYPFYTEVNIPANTYNNQTKTVTATAVMAMLVVPKNLDEYLVYNLTKNLFDQRHAKLELALKDMPITLHPGAQLYYNEKGIL